MDHFSYLHPGPGTGIRISACIRAGRSKREQSRHGRAAAVRCIPIRLTSGGRPPPANPTCGQADIERWAPPDPGTTLPYSGTKPRRHGRAAAGVDRPRRGRAQMANPDPSDEGLPGTPSAEQAPHRRTKIVSPPGASGGRITFRGRSPGMGNRIARSRDFPPAAWVLPTRVEQ